MNTFELETLTKANMTDIIVLSHKNREQTEHPGAQIKLSLEVSNNDLAYFDGGLKSFLYTKSAASSAAQSELEGVEPVTDMPNLTSAGMKLGKFGWDLQLTGYELEIDHGLGKKSNLSLEHCSISNFSIDPKEGGTVKLSFTLECQDVSEAKFGKLATMKNRDVQITLIAPEVVQGEVE